MNPPPHAGHHGHPRGFSRIEKRLRLAAIFVVAGLAVELASLPFIHPLAFMAFVCIGCALVAVGIVIYLISLVTAV